MPFYYWLKPRRGDRAATLERKQRASRKIRALRSALVDHIASAPLSAGAPPPTDRTKYLRLATWNLREFDSSSYGRRRDEPLSYIAEIIAHFDLVALQEIRRDLGRLNDLKSLLGPSWAYLVTDVTEGSAGNKERMALLYDKNKVWFRNIAGELTLPDGQKVTDPFGDRFMVREGAELELPTGQSLASPENISFDTLASGETKLKRAAEIPLPDGTKVTLPHGSSIRFAKNGRVPITPTGLIDIDPSENPRLPEAAEIVLPPNSLVGGPQQFARTPFIASFQSGWLKLNLAIVHILYGEGAAGMQRREEEIRRLTKLLADRARSDVDSDAGAHFIALGDFNIVGRDHATMDALRTNGFEVPEPLTTIPGSNVKKDKFYDQIAYWTGPASRRSAYTQVTPYRAGVFDFFDVVYRTDEEAIYRPDMKKSGSDDFYASYSQWRTHQMSDHLPMWVELRIDFAEEYLEEVDAEASTRLADSG